MKSGRIVGQSEGQTVLSRLSTKPCYFGIKNPKITALEKKNGLLPKGLKIRIRLEMFAQTKFGENLVVSHRFLRCGSVPRTVGITHTPSRIFIYLQYSMFKGHRMSACRSWLCALTLRLLFLWNPPKLGTVVDLSQNTLGLRFCSQSAISIPLATVNIDMSLKTLWWCHSVALKVQFVRFRGMYWQILEHDIHNYVLIVYNQFNVRMSHLYLHRESAMLQRHVSTIAQRGQTQYWL